MKATMVSVLILTTFLCLINGPEVQAVSPPPDGGYSGGNTAEGQNALFSLTTGGFNTATGWLSLNSNTTGSFNTAVGAGALALSTGDSNSNTATGAGALFSTILGGNTANGAFALFNNTTGGSNTAVGLNALLHNTTGDFNVAIGTAALSRSTGAGNIGLGVSAGFYVTTASNVICIGSTGANVSDTCYINNIRDVQTQNANAIPVLIDTAGQLGTQSSSRRFKEEVKPMERASEAILALRPVTFEYKSDRTNTPQFGLIAEEVAEINPDLVVHDKNGEIYSVRYDAVNAMLLNEFLKEHRKGEEQDRKIQEQQATITQLKKQIEVILAHSREQDALIQRVNDQVQMDKPAMRLAADTP